MSNISKPIGLDTLPQELLARIVQSIEQDSWRAILRNTCKALAWAVDLAEEEERDYWIDAESVCSSPSVLRWAVTQGGCPKSCAVTSAVVRTGRVDTLHAALGLGLPLHQQLCVEAAEHGHLMMLQHIHSLSSRHFNLNDDVFAAAANNGHLPVVQWLVKQNCPVRPTVCMEAAVRSNFDVIRWLYSEGYDLEVFSGKKRGCPVGWAGARDGDLDFLKWAMDHGAIINEDTCWGAASTGQLPVLRWLRETVGCPWDFQTLSAATSGGHLEVVQWCLDYGAPWNRETACMEAAAGGNVELMKLVRQLGCVWTGDEFLPAITEGNMDLLAWMKADGCPWPQDGGWVKAVTHAFHSRQGEAMVWLEGQLDSTPVEERTHQWELRCEYAREMLAHLKAELGMLG